MDILSIIGIIVSLCSLLLGNLLDGGDISSLLNGPALIIVFGGTIGATLLQFPPLIFLRSLEMSLWIFKPNEINLEAQIAQIVGWSHLARRRGLLGLEELIHAEEDPFLQKGLQLLVDGKDAEAIRDTLELEINHQGKQRLPSRPAIRSNGGLCSYCWYSGCRHGFDTCDGEP